MTLVAALMLFCCSPTPAAPPPARRPEVWWPAQKRLYWGEAETGAVHAIGLQEGISEYGVLRAASRHRVLYLALEADQAVLKVTGDDALYRYDARSLRLLTRTPTQGTTKKR